MPRSRQPFARPFLPVVFSVALVLGGCVSSPDRLADARLPLSPDECGQDTVSGQTCRFRNAPLALEPKPVTLPGRPYTFYPTARKLDFVDGKARGWTAARLTLTDGASIPPVFVSVIGNPRDPEFALAAAMHDAYCGIGNEAGPAYHAATWQDVHRMFYDTLVAGGTRPARAKIMFAAVWLGGPRWYPHSGAPDISMDRLPDSEKRQALRAAIAYINTANPSLPDLIRALDQQEREMKAHAQTIERAEDRASQRDREGSQQSP
ncbi:DUF1353 domain-containing protein [Fuscibacter oryzae]|uniref:DUF1353 domain-containing protein n=1 Tax=Fuscibacter oryzae TaxID=2803939 RepID=A0A8J7MRC4_9RHOB|nr:DUF1353 domain-containing protein [Fuscibacter oryzae]MBL4929850.1 DUF1353 domain-containing protein [Fuscibacter oryzae]